MLFHFLVPSGHHAALNEFDQHKHKENPRQRAASDCEQTKLPSTQLLLGSSHAFAARPDDRTPSCPLQPRSGRVRGSKVPRGETPPYAPSTANPPPPHTKTRPMCNGSAT